MPSLKNALASLSATKVEVIGHKSSQGKSLEALFLEHGFAASADPTTSSMLYSCDCGGPACCNYCECDPK